MCGCEFVLNCKLKVWNSSFEQSCPQIECSTFIVVASNLFQTDSEVETIVGLEVHLPCDEVGLMGEYVSRPPA